MQPLPIPQKFIDRALAEGADNIILYFSGGSDEGNLQVELSPLDDWDTEASSSLDLLLQAIEEWGLEAYEYNGAGEGIPYGDTIDYDLVNGVVTHQEWYYEHTFQAHTYPKIEVEKEEVVDE